MISKLSDEYKKLAPSYNEFSNKKHTPFLHRVSPASTLSVSVTGKSCSLNCSHCEGHYLKGMANINELTHQKLSKYKSILISGGSDKSGRVNIDEQSKSILELPESIRLNFHVGYQPPECLNSFKRRQIIVSFDLPTTDDVISKVYHLPYKASDYQKLYLAYAKKYPTIPHMTIGLGSEKDYGEENTIDFLSKTQPDQFVVIIFRPTKGTSLEKIDSPSISRVISLLRYAQKKLKCPVKIGCMRPSGKYRQNVDILAWMNGIRSIVQPHHALTNTLKNNSIEIINSDECCALNKEAES